MNLYIGGDSFCFYRDDPNTDWPLILANKLGMTLQGEGYPGSSWWLTRKHLKAFLASNDYTSNDIFIICHTDNIRPPIDYFPKVDIHISREEINRLWLTHFFSQDFSDWILQNWYQEISKLLSEHTVIHVNCFEYEQKFANLFNGYVYPTALLNLSKQEVSNQKDLMFDPRRNHFSTEKNQWLADEFFKILSTMTASRALMPCLNI